MVERTKTLLPGDKAGALEQVSPIQSPPLITRAMPQYFLVSTPCVCNYDRRTHGQSQRRKVLRMTLQALIFDLRSENCTMVTSESLKFWQTGENVCRQPPQGLCHGLALPCLPLGHRAALTPCLYYTYTIRYSLYLYLYYTFAMALPCLALPVPSATGLLSHPVCLPPFFPLNNVLPAQHVPTQQCSPRRARGSSQILSANVPQHCGPPQMFTDHIV